MVFLQKLGGCGAIKNMKLFGIILLLYVAFTELGHAQEDQECLQLTRNLEQGNCPG